MWSYVAILPAVNEHRIDDYRRNYDRAQEILDARPGGIARVSKPAKDCEGCGAPLKAYIHHCEYCRREK